MVVGGGAVVAWVSATALVWVCVAVLTPVALLAVYLVFATLRGWFPAGRRGVRRERAGAEPPPERGQAAGPDPPASTLPEIRVPLQVTLEQEKWGHWRQCLGIAELRFRITNVSGQQIRLARFELVSQLGNGSDKAQPWALSRELQRRRDAHRVCLRPMDLDEGDSVSGWWVQGLYLPPGVGRPRCKFTITDGIDDTYELEIPARPPQVRRLGG